ncbi:MAG: hypothetical protein O7F15_05015 [Gammaproteobacteria bacterium]|nr:hypothetical protein [Gammaproteobacteria bacterium]
MESNKLSWYRVKFIALVAVFLSPFIGGWMALYVFEIRPESGNYGTLVRPVKKLQWPVLESVTGVRYDDGFDKKWTFLLLTRQACAEQCRSNLYYMRQIRTLLGRDTARLQNVLISTPAIDVQLKAYLTDYPNLVVIQGEGQESLFSQFQVNATEQAGSTPRLYLVDPDDNYMMYYPAENDHYRILDDIKKLMKLSQIG